jgi:hypothetical protein
MPEKMKELHVTVSLNNFHKLGGKDESAYFVTIEGIGRFKHLLSYRTKQDAEALVTEMARSVAGIYMAESKSRADRTPTDVGGFGKKSHKLRKR